MVSWLRDIIRRVTPHRDLRVERLDRRSRVAVANVAEKLDDDELRRLAALRRAVKPQYRVRGR